MLILGAKGFAKEVLEVLHQLEYKEEIAFYDDVNEGIGDKLYGKFSILKTEADAKTFFLEKNKNFTIGIGNPMLRRKLYSKFSSLGGKLTSTISPKASIGHFGNSISDGCNIMTSTVITNDVKIGLGVLINLSCTIGHDCIINDFVEICPDVNVSGNCKIGAYSFIGSNAVILPGIEIGTNVTIGAGSVVNKNIPDNSIVVGIPGKVIKTIDPPKLD